MKLNLVIQSYLPSLTKSEQIVAHYVLEHNEQILHMTLQNMAKETGVGEATILRFCNKVGYDKFGSLKLALAMDLSDEEEENFDPSSSVLSSTKNEFNSAIVNTCDLLSEEAVQKAVTLIEMGEHLWFYGVGGSGLTALEAQSNFARIGIFSSAITDPHFQAMNAAVLSEKDVVVAFTISGSTKDIYESLSIAKKSGAKIIVVTNYIESQIAYLGDVVLLTAADEHVLKGGTIAGTVSQLFVLNAMKEEYILRHEKTCRALRKKCADSIISKSL